MVCAEGPMGVTSSPLSLLHLWDWDRWCSCQSWRGWASGKCVDLKQFSSSSRCCGWDEHGSEVLPCLEPEGELECYCHRFFLEVSTKCFGRWRKGFGWPVKDCWHQRGSQHHGRLRLPLFHNDIRYLGSSRKVLVRLVFYFLALSSLLTIFCLSHSE